MANDPSPTSQARGLAPSPVLVIALVTAICLLGDSALYVLLPSRLDVFAVSPTGAGLILGINRYARIVSNTAAAWVVERIGARGSFLVAVPLAAATTLSYGLFTGFWPLFFAHGLWGISWSFLRLGGYLAVADAADRGSVGRLMGVLQSVSRSGSLMAVIVGGILADAIGARNTFLVFGALTFGALGIISLGRVSPDLGRRPTPDTQPPAGKIVDGGTGDVTRLRTLYGEAAVTWLLVGGFASSAGYLVATTASDGVSPLGVALGVGTLTGNAAWGFGGSAIWALGPSSATSRTASGAAE